MSALSDAMRQIRGEMTYVEMAKRTGVSRQTLMALEAGELTKLSTLRQIAKACNVTEEQWDDLLVAWVEAELGPEDYARLITRLSPPADEKTGPDKLVLTAFKRLTNTEKLAIATAMMVRPVRALLPGLNQLYNQPPSSRTVFPKGYLHFFEKKYGKARKQE